MPVLSWPLLMAVIFLCFGLPVSGFCQKSSGVELYLETEVGVELINPHVDVFREYGSNLEPVDFSSKTLKYYDGGTRYYIRVVGGGTYLKERTFVVASPDTQLWIVPEGGKTREVAPPSAHLSGVISNTSEEHDGRIWVKLLSVPEFEEVADYLLGKDGHFEFAGLDSGIYLLVVLSRPERTTLPRILASQEVIVCETDAHEHVVVNLSEPASIRTQCKISDSTPAKDEQ